MTQYVSESFNYVKGPNMGQNSQTPVENPAKKLCVSGKSLTATVIMTSLGLAAMIACLIVVVVVVVVVDKDEIPPPPEGF